MKGDAVDPKGLIQDAYQIEAISTEECRSIFMDWALALPMDSDTAGNIGILLDRYGAKMAEHPMTRVLREGLEPVDAPSRRGGWRGRRRN